MPKEEEPYWKQRQNAVREAVDLRGIGGKVTPPEGMTPEQRERWEGTIKSEEEKREPSEYEKKMASVEEARLGGPAMDPEKVEQFGREITPEGAQTAAEMALSFTPLGPAIDAKDLFNAVKERDPLMATLSAAGLIGPFGGFDKVLRESLKGSTKTLKKVPHPWPGSEAITETYLDTSRAAYAELKGQLEGVSTGLQELQQGLSSRWETLSKIKRELLAEAASAAPLVEPEHVKLFRELADARGWKIDEITTSSNYKDAKEALYRAVSWKPSIPGMEVGQRTAIARYRQSVEAMKAAEETGQHLLEQADVIVMIKNTLKARGVALTHLGEFNRLKTAHEDVFWDLTDRMEMSKAHRAISDRIGEAREGYGYAQLQARDSQRRLLKRLENSYWMKQLWRAD